MEANDFGLQILALVFTSSVISSLIVAWFGRRKERAESIKYTAEARSENAEAATTFMELSLRLQEQRELDRQIYERRIAELESRWNERFESLRRENEELKRERDELAAHVKILEERLAVLENGG